ncbi:HNH endonuclease signature motif containing protein [Cryobacterium sp. PH31-AA6]|uniref:HNH endonuclease signature motif containing protein n=1 Tax=Cryobacterium sp. PH31-AA6 TaxID=3046205 RepID=UPI0024B8FF07|nr:HNH endonuclease signature motif containing protein [Cryobacterium sp. PH31-AA6]MDJ0324733.1 HNH endonuclease signature motif containing protein [Cryobacterium sp. PH31-AA6]
MTSIEAVIENLAESLARSKLSASVFAELSDEESERAHSAISLFLRSVTTVAALSAANIDRRSGWELGREGLARRNGFRNSEEFVQHLGGGGAGTRTDARRLIEAGTMATVAELARRRQEKEEARRREEEEAAAESGESPPEHPEQPAPSVQVPWFAPLGEAVAASVLGAEAATLIRRGLGEPALGVTEDMLRDALVPLIEDCRSMNADQAARAARQARDAIDAAGIAARADAMRARQYLRVYDKPDGMLHGNFELDPENGSCFRDFLLQVTGPRTGGPRFVEAGEKARAQAIIDDPRSTDQIAAESLIEAIRVAAAANPGVVFGRTRASVKVVVQARATEQGDAPKRAGDVAGDGAGAGAGAGVGVGAGAGAGAGVGAAGPGRGLALVAPGIIEGTTSPAPTETINRLICDSGFIPIVVSAESTSGDVRVLNVGREQRLFTAAQRAALAVRDGGCMMPGCLKPPSWTEAHHLDGWTADGGLTDLADGILLCAPDHLRLHNEHWKIVRTGTEYFLIPPPNVDAGQKPIRLVSKSALQLGSPLRLGADRAARSDAH